MIDGRVTEEDVQAEISSMRTSGPYPFTKQQLTERVCRATRGGMLVLPEAIREDVRAGISRGVVRRALRGRDAEKVRFWVNDGGGRSSLWKHRDDATTPEINTFSRYVVAKGQETIESARRLDAWAEARDAASGGEEATA